MSYSQNHVTLIDDLPLLEDIDKPKTHGLTMIPETEVNKYQKFLRNSGYDPPLESGMMSKQSKQPKHMHQNTQQNIMRNDNLEFKNLPPNYMDEDNMRPPT